MPLSLSRPPSLLADVTDEHRGAVPIGRRRIEDPREGIAVGRGRQAVSHRQDRDLIDRRLRDQRQGDACRIRIEHHRVLRLDLFVAFETLLGVVAGLAFLDDQLDAADAAVTLVQHVEVVGHAVDDRRAGAGERAGTVRQQRDIDPVGSAGRRRRQRQPGRNRDSRSEHTMIHSHHIPSLIWRRVAACWLPTARLAWSSVIPVCRGLAESLHRQYGKGHTLSFCLPICHSRARPFGSAIRNRTINAPITMY